MRWNETIIETQNGVQKAIAPEVISASRSTDIPAFYAEWFINRLRQGYVKWVNPFNQRPQYISFKNTSAIVFWSKNPRPLMQFLDEIDARQMAYYFHFTLNDYEYEKLEPGVPSLSDRIKTFQELSNKIGKDRVIWRFDPLILTNGLNIESLLEKIKRVGDQISPYTEKFVFSFADIGIYKKVQTNLKRSNIEFIEFSQETMIEVAKEIESLCNNWGIIPSTCAEPVDLSRFGISHNRCIDENLILKITKNSHNIQNLYKNDSNSQGDLFNSNKNFNKNIKDPGQRAECGCVFSKDIGQYNTCPHLCVYCYANKSENSVNKNINSISTISESIIVSQP